MTKKAYKHPSMKVIELDSTSIIAQSGNAKSLKMNSGAVDNTQQGSISDEIWGKQW